LIAALSNGTVSATPDEQVIQEFGAIRVVGCDNGPGRYSALLSMNIATDLADGLGVGVCLAKNTSHWGRAHAYVSRAAKQGYIGICTTNAIPTMAAWGAKSKVFGKNPLAIAVAGITADETVVLDMAMSQASVGKVATMLDEGKHPSENLGFDADGQPSADPEAILAGAVSAMGVHKGEGLALMMELLTAPLAGAMVNTQRQTHAPSGVDPNATKLFIAINVSALIPVEEYRENLRQLFEHLKHTTPNFTYPGERGWNTKKDNLKNGIPITNKVVAELAQIGVHF